MNLSKIIQVGFMLFMSLLAVGSLGAWISSDPSPPPPVGEFQGIVAGPENAGLVGAKINLRHIASGKNIRVVSGNRGLYRAAGLAPGVYEFRIELEGFEPKALTNINIAAGETRTVDIKLDVATIHNIVTVTGALPKASLEAAETRESSARDIGEALADIDGVAKVRKGGIANDVALRGFASKDLNVLIDGQRIYGACPNQMDPALFHADFAEVDRVEISKGPFDIKNQGGLGGLIDILTRRPQAGFHANLVASGGSFGYINPTATASFGADSFSALAGYSYRRSGPYRDGAGKRFTDYANFRSGLADSDAFRVGTVWAKLSASPRSNHLLRLSYAHQESDHILYPYLQMDALYDDSDRANLDYQVEGGETLKFVRLQGYFTDVRHRMTDDFRTSSFNLARSYSMGTTAKTRTFGGKVEASFKNFLIGVEAFRRGWNATTELGGSGYQTQYSIPNVTTDTFGLYGTYDWSIANRLELVAGARIDTTRSAADSAKANTSLTYAYNSTQRTSARDTYPSASVSLTYRISTAVKITGNLGSMVRVPDARERYFGLRRMGSDWVGNPELEPSRNTGGDLTLSVRSGGLSLESSVYLNFVADFITVQNQKKVNAVAGVMNTAARSYQNVDARMFGTDLNLAYTITPRMSLSGGFSYVQGIQAPIPEKEIFSRNLAEIPPLWSKIGLRYDDGFLMAEVEGQFVAAQTRVNADLREEKTPGYGIANAKIGANFKGLALRLGLDNIFNNDYVQYLSFQRDPFRNGVRVKEPGTTLFLGLTYRF